MAVIVGLIITVILTMIAKWMPTNMLRSEYILLRLLLLLPVKIMTMKKSVLFFVIFLH